MSSPTWQNRPHTFVSRLAFTLLRHLGWTVVLAQDQHGTQPKKAVMVVFPHTSNLDFPIGILWKWATRTPIHFVGKKELFSFPLGIFMRAMGGLAVDRQKVKGRFVDAAADLIKEKAEIVVAIAPEGTRSHTQDWRTGFYYMAQAADVPFVTGVVDWGKKEVGITHHLKPCGDLSKDVDLLSQMFQDVKGRKTHNQGVIRITDSKEQKKSPSKE